VLKAECGNIIRAADEIPSTSSSTQTEAPSSTQQPTPSSSIYLLLFLYTSCIL